MTHPHMLPTIDVSALVDGTTRRGETAAAIGQACSAHGVFYATGHGIAPVLTQRLGPAVVDDGATRWDQAHVHAFHGRYGDYLLDKVSKVVPQLVREVLQAPSGGAAPPGASPNLNRQDKIIETLRTVDALDSGQRGWPCPMETDVPQENTAACRIPPTPRHATPPRPWPCTGCWPSPWSASSPWACT
jgi:hypothetical protein